MTAQSTKEKITFDIGGMNCAACAATVEKVLNETEGICSASVNIATEKGTVIYNPDIMTRETMTELVENSGYKIISFENEGNKRNKEEEGK